MSFFTDRMETVSKASVRALTQAIDSKLDAANLGTIVSVDREELLGTLDAGQRIFAEEIAPTEIAAVRSSIPPLAPIIAAGAVEAALLDARKHHHADVAVRSGGSYTRSFLPITETNEARFAATGPAARDLLHEINERLSHLDPNAFDLDGFTTIPEQAADI